MIKRSQEQIIQIKRELDELLSREPTLSSELDHALSYLRLAQDLLDQGKDLEVLGPLARAKSAAIQSILNAQTVAAVHLRDGLYVGRHILRDGRGWKTGVRSISGLWSVSILPSFDPPAMLTVVHEGEGVLGAFGVGTSPDAISTSIISVQFASDWIDPVIQILHELDLFDPSCALVLDGIEYTMRVDTTIAKTQLCFFSPTTDSFIKLEQALFNIAGQMVNLSGGQAEQDYLSLWERQLMKRCVR